MKEITYKWTISAIDCLPTKNGFENVVDVIHWRYRGNCVENKCFETYGVCSIPNPNPDTFTPTEGLTFEQITSWLEGSMDMDELKERVASGLMVLEQPETIKISLNWDENNINEPLTF